MPIPLRRITRRLWYFPADALEWLLGRRKPLHPPRGKNFAGAGDFQRIGEEFMRYFVELAGLRPDERVLDVGCGIGRMAVPLTCYLSSRGGYEGFDVVREGIDWCRKEITRSYPNFHFQHADLWNREYNPRGKLRASAYRFPYPDDSFDFALVVSVFTHMLPPDVENYLAQITRVLKPGARCLSTFFLFDEEARRCIREGKSILDFVHHFGTYSSTHARRPEAAVCYEEAFILDLHRKCGLEVRQPVYHGAWSGRADYLSSQDIIIASAPDVSL